MRWHWLLRGLLLLVFVLLGGVTWLSTTQRGLDLVVDFTHKLVPNLTIVQAQGSLLGPIQLKQIKYQPDVDTQYQIKQLRLVWQPRRLLQGQLYINSLHIKGVTVQTPASQPKTQSEKLTLPKVRLPLQIVVDDFQLTQVQQIYTQHQAKNLIQKLQLQAQLKRQELKIKSLHLKRADADLNLQGQLMLLGHYPVQISYDYTLHLPDFNEIKASGQINGDVQHMIIVQQLTAPVKSRQTVQLDHLLGDLHWQADIHATKIKLSAIQPKATQTGQINQLTASASGNLQQIKAQLKGQFKQNKWPPLTAEIHATTINLKDWQLSALLKLSAQSQLTLKGQINNVLQRPLINLNGDWQQLRWPLTGKTIQVASPKGQLQLSGSMEKYQLQLAGQLIVAQQKVNIQAEATGKPQQIKVSRLHINALSGSADIQGLVQLTAPQPQIDLTANWKGLKIPKVWSAIPVKSDKGHLQLQGSAQDFTLRSKLALNVDGQAINVHSNGKGSQDGFKQLQLNITTDSAGSAGFSGQLGWQPDIKLAGTIVTNKFNPAFIAANWPGQLSGQGQIKLLQTPERKLLVDVNALKLSGRLRQRSLNLAVNQVHYQSRQIRIDKLQLRSAQSVLTADGRLSDKWQLQWRLNSPDLSDFYPKLKGKLKAKGELTGNATQPRISTDIAGSDLAYDNKVTVKNIWSDINLSLAKDAQINGRVSLQHIVFRNHKFDSLQLTLNGTKQDHWVKFKAVAPALTVEGGLKGQWQQAKSVWQGHFTHLNLVNKQAGNWQLHQAGQIRLSATHNELGQQCLASDKGQLCISAKQDQKRWQAQGKISELPLSMLTFLTPKINKLKGNVNGSIKLNGQGKQLTGQGRLQLQQAELHLDNASISQTKSFKFKQFAMDYQLTPQQTQLQFNIEPDMKGVSALKGELNTEAVKTWLDNSVNAGLRGQLHLTVADLSQLHLNLPQIDDLHGVLDLNAIISGTVTKPEMNLNAKLQQGKIGLPSAGIVLTSVAATVKGNLDGGIQFQYQAKSGKGQVSGEGSVTSLAKSWQLKTRFRGHNFQLMNLPEAYVIASPDIQVDMTPAKSKISGQLIIPEAALEPLEFNMPVSPSNDVVIVTKHPQPVKKAIPMQMNLKIKLGDKVKIKAMGFQGNLTGDLLITGDANNLLLGTGDITINKGTYLAYGQLLKVDNGKIHFSGGALDNPDLDIKAVRTGTNYSVGVHIEGPVNQPQASLFSDPTMSQDDILSYLLLGHPIKQASATDAALLASAASGMGIQNGAMLGDQIASAFGLDVLTVSGDSRENAALQIGKYLSPKLYLSYGVGVFQPVTTVQLRYQLSKIWSLKAESGTQSGVDLMYNYER